MKTYKEYESYILTTMSILQDYYKLPKIQVKMETGYGNCTFDWTKQQKEYFIFDLTYIMDIFDTELEDREKVYDKKIKRIKILILFMVLHELGHYNQYIKLGAKAYEKISDSDRYSTISYRQRKVEKFANKFSRDNYNEASYFIEECLK